MPISGGDWARPEFGREGWLAEAILAHGARPHRLRRLSEQEIAAAVERLRPEDIDLALEYRLLPLARTDRAITYAAGSRAGLAYARRKGLKITALGNRHHVLAYLQEHFDRRLKHISARRLMIDVPDFSAWRRVTPVQGWFGVIATIVVLVAAVTQGGTAMAIAGSLCSLFFLLVIGLRLLSLGGPVAAEHLVPVEVPDDALPEFTILVPLFREIAVVGQILESMAAIDYPADRLDVKIVLEESDRETVDYVRNCALPPHFEVIVVPRYTPQTKPKALNYALALSHGELVAVYDAEDVPDPRQLRLAAGVFAKAPADLACVQGHLEFFNADDNWLTRQFAIEYAVLFRRLLPVLASLSLPLPLGGTSNHFRASTLRKVGGWDPHNVTEDADLGLRLARLGHRTGVIDSGTSEEANGALGNWMQQRARWLKGWMQTWLVHMRAPMRLYGELGWAGFLTTQAWLAGLIFSSLVHPFFMAYTIWLIATGGFFPERASPVGTAVVGLNLAVLFAGYAAYVLVACEALSARRDRHLRIWLALTPIYWLLISAAAWLALWQLLRDPFGWNKTRHGLVRRPRGTTNSVIGS